jgi:hypothetical protein
MIVVLRACLGGLVLALAGCGGSSGGSSAAALPDLAENIVPSGARIDVSSRNYFALSEGAGWEYERRFDDGSSTTFSRGASRSNSPEAPIDVTESDGTTVQRFGYRVSAAGVEAVQPFGDVSQYPGVAAALPTLLEYPTPFYPVNGERTIVRQGDLGADLDGDGTNERFRLQFTQVFRGFQTMQVMGRTTEVAAFRNTFNFIIYATRDGRQLSGSSYEDAYFADGVGLVRSDRSSTGPNGQPLTPNYRLTLTVAVVAGLNLTPGSFSTELLPLARRDLVYDPARSLYYATVSDAEATIAGRIAIIDSRDGSTTYSRVVGLSPGPLAVATDGSVLYVGLQGSGDVVKLALPAMTEVSRLRLPVEPFNQTQFLPDDIAVSPSNADLVAVSLYRSGSQPQRHAGVMLVRQMAPLPRRTLAYQGGNALAFDAAGRQLFAYANEGTGGRLFRLEVLPDGLIEREANFSIPSGLLFWTKELTLEDGVLMVANFAYRAEAPLTSLGVTDGIHCTKLPGIGKIVCQSLTHYGDIEVYDAATFSLLGTVSYAQSGSIEDLRLVPGPQGQVAIFQSGRVQLFSNALLQ